MACVHIIPIVLMLASTQSLAELSPQNTHNYILEPNVLTLECSLKTPNATWYKDSVKLHNNSNGYIMKSFGNNPWIHSLTKTNTSVNDTGKYRCATAAKSFSYNVVIFKVITHDIVIASKEPALIKCDLQNLDKDQVQDFYWIKNRTILTKRPELKGRYTVHKDNYTLEIPKAKRRDAGPYFCVFSINKRDFSINVNMNMAPWIESMEKSRNLVQTDKLHLECHVESYPFSTVYWKKDNETFKNDASNRVFTNNNRTLIIYDLQFSDKGEYTCVATNIVNTTSMTVLVRVKDKLAALWPFLGIVAEVVILCIIIFICEKRRSKDMEDEYENAGQQSMPNATDHKGKDEIRQRNVRT
ncbi:NPTN [Acanthosepion pharaonis]|uniref:NPTN n=1 Tax=Acanthosepion pharaonis TaxID=158019 RepID=A0A812CYY1_ACAPH|nr:NPTN [Sepia pharaonis]